MSNVLCGGDDAFNNATSTARFGRSVESRAQMLDAQAEAAPGDQNEALNLYRLKPIAAPVDPRWDIASITALSWWQRARPGMPVS